MKLPFDGNIDKTSGDFQLRISLENCFAYGGDGVMRVLVIPDIHLKTWTFDRAIAFAVDYPDTLWCYGNHDVSYPWGRLETGYSPYAERTVISKLEELENSLKSPTQINIIHRIDIAILKRIA